MIRLITVTCYHPLHAFSKFTFHQMIRLITLQAETARYSADRFTFHQMIRLITKFTGVKPT